MTIAQLNSNDMPSPEDHLAQGEKILATALEMAGKSFPVFPVHGLRWVRSIVPVGAATAVPGGDLGRDGIRSVANNIDGGENEQEEELEVAQRIELRCTCGVVSCANIGKHPVGGLVPHGSKEASTDQLQVAAWFAVPSLEVVRERGWVPWNLALATGAGIVVIDAEARQINASLPTGLDVMDDWENWTRGTSLPPAAGVTNSVIVIAEDGSIGVQSTGDLKPSAIEGELEREGYWPGTLRVRTGSGGLHVYVRVSPDLRIKSRNRVLPAVDIKADGGYVLVPPSRHASGGVYSIAEGRWSGIASAAEDLVGWLLTVKGGRYATRRLQDTGAGSSEPTDYDFHRIVAGNGCPAGFRDYFINDLCFRLRRAGVRLEDASAALRKEWARMEQPKDEFYDWQTCLYKLRRVWEEVTPEDVTDLPAWRPPGEGQVPEVRMIGPAVAEDQLPVTIVLDGEEPLDLGQGSAWNLLGRRELTMLLTDTGNAMRYAQRMRDQVRYSPEIDKWFVWDGTRWALDTRGKALLLTKEIIQDLFDEARNPALSEAQQQNLERWADQTQSVSRRQAMLALAKSEPGISIEAEKLDANPDQLVVLNGTIDLRTGTLRPSLADDMNTMCANVEFDAEAKCPQWLEHINFVTGGKASLARYLQRAIGYTLTGSTKEQKLFFLHGSGQNGKNTFTDVIAALMGDYAYSADENFISGGSEHPTQIAVLRGKRLVYADETEENNKIKERRLKKFTGSKTLTGRFMRQDYFEFTPRFKLWIMGNHKPSITGNDEGIWRRLKLVPFDQILSADRKRLGYDEILIEELPGILNWALEGLKQWYRFQDLGESEEVTKATMTYRQDEDEESEFFAERVILCPEENGGVMAFGQIFQEYRLWCGLTGTDKDDIKGKKAFAQELERRGFIRPEKPRRIPGYASPQRVWLGGRLRTPEDSSAGIL